MSGDWLKFDVTLPEKPEVWQIAGILAIDPDAVVGKLMKVWRWFDQHTEDGNARSVTYALVDSLVGVTGFAEAMALCGWLEQDGSTLRVPNFARNNGKTAKKRALTAKRVADCKSKSNAEGNALSVTSALPREEKRREDIKDTAPVGATKPKPPKTKSEKLSFDDFVAACADGGVDLIPSDDPVYDYAERIGLPDDYVTLAWSWFARRYADKRQTGIRGWRQAFRNAVEGNWPKLWYRDEASQGWALTTAGKQAQLEAANAG